MTGAPVPHGAEARAGQVLLPRGLRIDFAHVNLLAMVGRASSSGSRAPSVPGGATSPAGAAGRVEASAALDCHDPARACRPVWPARKPSSEVTLQQPAATWPNSRQVGSNFGDRLRNPEIPPRRSRIDLRTEFRGYVEPVPFGGIFAQKPVTE
jgi:hypothetical protein